MDRKGTELPVAPLQLRCGIEKSRQAQGRITYDDARCGPCRLLRLPSCRVICGDRGFCVLCRPRPCQTSNLCPGQEPAPLVNRRGFGDGIWYLVHALRWDVGLPPAGPGAVRLAHGFMVVAGCNSRVCRRAFPSQSIQVGSGPGLLGQHPHGRRYRSHALHWHGRHAATRDVPLLSTALHTLCHSRHCHFFCGSVVDVPPAGRRGDLAENDQCTRDGGCDPGHALHRHGRCHFYSFHVRSRRPVSCCRCFLFERGRDQYCDLFSSGLSAVDGLSIQFPVQYPSAHRALLCISLCH